MAANSQRPKGRGRLLSTFNVTIEALNLAKEISNITTAKAVFGSVSALLTIIKVSFFLFCKAASFRLILGQESMINEEDYVHIGLNCADICTALDRETNGKKLGDLRQSVHEAINQLTTWVELAVHILSG